MTLTKRYDRVVARSQAGGRTVLETTLLNPEPIAGNDILYLAILNVAKIQRDGGHVIAADPGRPGLRLPQRRPREAGTGGVRCRRRSTCTGAKPAHAVSASYAVADIQMPEVRYLVDPAKPPLAAVERF